MPVGHLWCSGHSALAIELPAVSSRRLGVGTCTWSRCSPRHHGSSRRRCGSAGASPWRPPPGAIGGPS